MSLYGYFLFVCAGSYLVLLAAFYIRQRQLIPSGWLGLALLTWHLLLVPEFLSLLGLMPYMVAVSSMLCWLPVIIMTAIYLAVRKLVIHASFPPSRLIWLPALATLCSQFPVIVVALTDGFIIHDSPVGSPLQYWYLYLTYLLAGLSMMALGIMATEDVQQYHYSLGNQVVDAGQYRLCRLTSVLAKLVSATFVKAEEAVIAQKAYKIVGLRIADVATMARVDPTDLAIVTRALKTAHFVAGYITTGLNTRRTSCYEVMRNLPRWPGVWV